MSFRHFLNRAIYISTRLPRFFRLAWVRSARKWLVRAYYGRGDLAPPPTMLTLRISTACNLRCKQCGQWGDRGAYRRPEAPRSITDLTTAEWEQFIARAAKFCPHIYFFGGEPFLRRDLLHLVRYAVRHRVITGVNTNGTYLRRNSKA